MYNPFSLEGKTVLVTGASSGIGRGIAVECSKMGAKVVINGRNKERLQNTFDQLEGEGHIQIAADLSKQEDIERLADEVPELNGFVNSAGIPKICPVKRIDRDTLEEIMNVNADYNEHLILFGPDLLCLLLHSAVRLPVMQILLIHLPVMQVLTILRCVGVV